jgi:hypothetical protein
MAILMAKTGPEIMVSLDISHKHGGGVMAASLFFKMPLVGTPSAE